MGRKLGLTRQKAKAHPRGKKPPSCEVVCMRRMRLRKAEEKFNEISSISLDELRAQLRELKNGTDDIFHRTKNVAVAAGASTKKVGV